MVHLHYWQNHPVIGTLIFLWVFYQLFLACVGAYAGWKNFPLWVKVMESPLFLFAGTVDVITEFSLAVLLFMQLPPLRPDQTGQKRWWSRLCWTVTQRLSYNQTYLPNTKRGRASRAICRHMLDPAQVGGHCSGGTT